VTQRLLRPSSRAWGAMIATALVVALSIPAAASAHRLATKAEAAAMIYSASGRYYGNARVAEPRSAPLRCFTADISTVVNGSRWGAWTFSEYAEAHEQLCRIANGVTVEHKVRNQWYVFWEGSEGYPPTHKTRVGTLTLMGVPRAVAKDLDRGLS
jgi:hypothetical protein